MAGGAAIASGGNHPLRAYISADSGGRLQLARCDFG
jgi:hypothetical protein